ncbi:MAG: hypothetical protein MJ172_08665 [Clostridia bacterium]|nr:hypothetical protein [Clostridia bacterium]
MNMFADSVSDEKKSFITDLEDLSFEVDDMKKDALMVVSLGGLYKIYIDDLLMANSNNTFVAFEL